MAAAVLVACFVAVFWIGRPARDQSARKQTILPARIGRAGERRAACAEWRAGCGHNGAP